MDYLDCADIMDDKNCNGNATPRLHGLRGRDGLSRTQRHEKTPNSEEKHYKNERVTEWE